MSGFNVISTQNVDIPSTQTVTGAKTFQNLAVTTNALNLSVGQLQYPASQNASADANCLDDYKESTFVPTVIGTSTAGTGTYSVQKGTYTKIGNRVMFTIELSWSGHTGTGNINLSGLPYTTNATASTEGSLSTYMNGLALTAGNILQAYTNVNAITITLEQVPTGGGSSVAVPMDTSVTALTVQGHFFV